MARLGPGSERAPHVTHSRGRLTIHAAATISAVTEAIARRGLNLGTAGATKTHGHLGLARRPGTMAAGPYDRLRGRSRPRARLGAARGARLRHSRCPRAAADRSGEVARHGTRLAGLCRGRAGMADHAERRLAVSVAADACRGRRDPACGSGNDRMEEDDGAGGE